jgi:hypothetical protein
LYKARGYLSCDIYQNKIKGLLKNTILHNLKQLRNYFDDQFSLHRKKVKERESETRVGNDEIMENYILGMTNQCENISTE